MNVGYSRKREQFSVVCRSRPGVETSLEEATRAGVKCFRGSSCQINNLANYSRRTQTKRFSRLENTAPFVYSAVEIVLNPRTTLGEPSVLLVPFLAVLIMILTIPSDLPNNTIYKICHIF